MPYPSLPAYKPPEEHKPEKRKPVKREKAASVSVAQEKTTDHSAKLDSWDKHKGYGFLRHGKGQ
ncbi:MAG: hypothetical protein ACPG6P_07010, partial [Akkermansiaceae bacterium]